MYTAEIGEFLYIPPFFTRGKETFENPTYFTKGGVGYIFEYKSQNNAILLKVAGTTGKENKISHLKGEVEAYDILQHTGCKEYFAKIFTSDIIGYIWARVPNEKEIFRSPLLKKHREKMYVDEVEAKGSIYKTPGSVSYTFMEKCLPYKYNKIFVYKTLSDVKNKRDEVKRIVDAQMCLMKKNIITKTSKWINS